jgi:hypothetical protein
MRVSIVRISAAAVLFALGCGSGGQGGTTATTPAGLFAGTWTFASGAIDFGNPCLYPTQIDLTGDTMTITEDDDTDVTAMFTATRATCDIGFTVSVPVATVKAGQTCTISGTAGSGVFQIANGDMYFNGNPSQLILQLGGSFTQMGPAATTCDVNAEGSFPTH